MTSNVQKLLAWQKKFSNKKPTEEDVSLVLASLDLNETKGKKSPIPKGRRGSKSSEVSAASSNTEGCPYVFTRGAKSGTKCNAKSKDPNNKYCSSHKKKSSPEKGAAVEKKTPRDFTKNVRLDVFVNPDKYYGEQEPSGHVIVLGKVVNGSLEAGLSEEDIEYCKENKLKWTSKKSRTKETKEKPEEEPEENDSEEEVEVEVKKPVTKNSPKPPPKGSMKKSPAILLSKPTPKQAEKKTEKKAPVKEERKEEDEEESEDEEQDENDTKSEVEEESQKISTKISTKIAIKAIGISESDEEEEAEEMEDA